MSDLIGGYEWGWTCGECDERHDLSGMMGSAPTVNGEENAIRTRSLESGDTLQCAECGHTIEIQLTTIEDN